MKIYGVYMDRPLSPREEDRMMAAVSAEKREKCQRFYHKEDAHRTLLGDMLIRTIAGRAYGLNPAAIVFSVREYGKPYIPRFRTCTLIFPTPGAGSCVPLTQNRSASILKK